MTTRYSQELARLPEVYDAVRNVDTTSLTRMIECHLDGPLLCVGSGGSLSTANYLSFLHQNYCGQIAKAVTPLEYLDMPACDSGVICLTARGKNKDVNSAFRSAAVRERGPVGALVMAANTPLHSLAQHYAHTDVAEFPCEMYRDGFLAVASLVASAFVLLRCYNEVAGRKCTLPDDFGGFTEATLGAQGLPGVARAATGLMGLQTVSVLYTPGLQAAVVDLESRFVEGALGYLQAADFRNFGHGRHHWLARHAETTSVLALVEEGMDTLATRTLSLLPKSVPRARIDVAGNPAERALAGLLVSLHVSEVAGRAACIDPSRPGIPEFGRKLYRLGPPRRAATGEASDREAALRRKASYRALQDPKERGEWELAYSNALKRLAGAEIGAIVSDYDGTLCDGRKRFEPPPPAIGEAIGELLATGLTFAIATGRGPSAGRALREVLPRRYWNRVVLGYYNGGILTTLDDSRDPLVEETAEDELLQVIRAEGVFPDRALHANAVQISIRLEQDVLVEAALESARRAVARAGVGAQVTASSHSIDIVRGDRSKLSVVTAVAAMLDKDSGAVLRIGDKGAWPGNDADLLDDPLGLSVDRVSGHREHCWNLAPAGVLGVQATLHYLRRLEPDGPHARFVGRKPRGSEAT